MPIADPPLTGWRVAVVGDDPALRHASSLLTWLGAHVVGEPDEEAAVLLELADAAAPSSVTTARTHRCTAAGDWARSGAMMLTGRADGPPLLAPGAPASAIRGALLVCEALVLLRDVERPAQWPDVRLLGERAAVAGLTRQGPRSAGGSYRPVKALDGWGGLSLVRSDDVDCVPALIEASVDGDAWCAIDQWAASRTADQVASRAQLLGLAGVQIGVAPDAQPFELTRGRSTRPRSTPMVVDLTSLWAGPLCAHLLGLAGARIVKVESVHRPDGARFGPAPFFDLLHAGHEAVALDFATPSGRAALAALVGAADIVVESSRPRALRQLGIEADDVVASGTTWVSITAYGRTGPWANRVGYGDDVAAAAGLVVYDSGEPMPCGDALADPLAGVHAAAAALAALVSGHSYLVDVSMRDVAASTLVIGDETSVAIEPQPPTARHATGRSRELGRDTVAVLNELGIRV